MLSDSPRASAGWGSGVAALLAAAGVRRRATATAPPEEGYGERRRMINANWNFNKIKIPICILRRQSPRGPTPRRECPQGAPKHPGCRKEPFSGISGPRPSRKLTAGAARRGAASGGTPRFPRRSGSGS